MFKWLKKDPSEIGIKLRDSYLYGKMSDKDRYINEKGNELLIELKVAVDSGRHCIILSVDSPRLIELESEFSVYFTNRNIYFNPIDIDIPGFGMKHHWYLSVLTVNKSSKDEAI
jgi:hypothetical protein